MKIGIVTIHNASNYGAVLQAYALQKVLSNKFDAKIINYANPLIMKELQPIRFGLNLRDLYFSFQDILYFSDRRKILKKFQHFFDSYMSLTPLYTASELMNNSCEPFDVYISGSDQIWNPHITKIVDPIYFCQMAPTIAKKISYASSFGNYCFNNQKELKIIDRYLGDYSFVSTRESGAIAYLKEYFGIKAYHVLDPVLLLTKKQWEETFSLMKQKQEEPYLLVYTVSNMINITELAVKLAKVLNLKVRVIGRWIKKKIGGVDYITMADPVDFVQLIYGAALVITNSFHGTAFCVNFNCPFISIENVKNPDRVQSLLSLIGMTDHIIKNTDEISIDELANMKFSHQSQALEEQREKSIAFLENAIFS